MDAWAGVGSHTHMPPLTLHWPLRPLAAGCRLPSSAGQERGELCRGNQGLGRVNRVISRLKGPKKRTHGSQGISHLVPTGMSLQHAASGLPCPGAWLRLGRRGWGWTGTCRERQCGAVEAWPQALLPLGRGSCGEVGLLQALAPDLPPEAPAALTSQPAL